MNEAIENVVVSETDDEMVSPVPARVPGAFVVDLLEDTGRMDRGEAELLLTWFEWVEVEVRGFPGVLEGLFRLRGAVMKAAAVGGGAPRCFCLVCDPVLRAARRGGDGTCVPSLHHLSSRAGPVTYLPIRELRPSMTS